MLNEAHHMSHVPIAVGRHRYLYLGGLISANVFRCDVADPLQSFNLQASVVDQSADSATVAVSSLRTVASSSGCQSFSGTYGLVRSGSGWLIGSNDLSQAAC